MIQNLHLKLHKANATVTCPSCKIGRLCWNGTVLYTDPATYSYTCNYCNETFNLNRSQLGVE